jgi:diguanylate cyclase (GGDEF)-like protein/PAS domain S-box-containing protein
MSQGNPPPQPSQRALVLAAEIVEQSDDAIVSKLPDGTVLSWNRSAERVFGYSAAEMIGHSIARIVPAERQHEEPELMALVRAGGDVSQFETQRVRKDGSKIDISVSLTPIRDAAGDIIAVSKIARDITARKKAERAMRASQKRLLEIFDSAPIGMLIAPIDRSRVIEANHKFCTFLGYSLDELRKLSVRDFAHPDDMEESTRGVRLLLEGSVQTFAFERRYRRKDGRYVWGRASATLIQGDESGTRELLVQVEDIEQRKAAEFELRGAKERLAMALEASDLSIWEFDVAAGVVTLDERWATMMGLPPGPTRTTAAHLAHITHPDDVEKAIQSAVYAFKGDAPGYVQESRLQSASGEWKWVRCSGKVVQRDADGRALRAIGTNLDVSARKATEESIRVMAFFDALTGLPNRTLFLDRLQQAVAAAHRSKKPMSVLYLDLDGFKPINDARGHETGDLVLRDVARRFQRILRESDTLGRLGGDEFAIVAPNTDAAEAMVIARRIRGSLEAPISVGGDPLPIEVSVGISSYPEDGATPDELLRRSDMAMYRAKVARRSIPA